MRSVISAMLVLEAIAIGLGITAIARGDDPAGATAQWLVGALALAHLLAVGVAGRRWVFGVVAVLQVLLIACWAIDAALGVTGIVFTLVWVIVAAMYREYHRRLAQLTTRDAAQQP